MPIKKNFQLQLQTSLGISLFSAVCFSFELETLVWDFALHIVYREVLLTSGKIIILALLDKREI